MRLYVIQDHDERPLAWAGSQEDAATAVADQGGRQFAGWVKIDVPTDKAGLLEWLNKHGTVSGPTGEGPAAAECVETDVDTSIDAIEGAITDMTPPHVARVAIAAIEQLTVTGQPALTALRGLIAETRPAGFFTAGAHVLTALALSEIATGKRITG